MALMENIRVKAIDTGKLEGTRSVFKIVVEMTTDESIIHTETGAHSPTELTVRLTQIINAYSEDTVVYDSSVYGTDYVDVLRAISSSDYYRKQRATQ